MYTIMIVDDEQLMRTYLANNITAICPYYQITGIASDGFEALELLKKQQFDLVITDIRMPEVDGLSVAKYIHENCPLTKIVIISGYNEFEYARTAIKYQVTEYLLKPLKDSNLNDVLFSIKEQLDSDKKQELLKPAGSYSQLSDYALLSALLASILDGDSTLTYPLFNEAEKRNLHLMKSYGLMVRFSIDELNLLLFQKSAFDISTHHLKLNQLCQTYCQENNLISFYDNYGSTFVLVDAEKKEALSNRTIAFFNKFLEKAQQNNLPKMIATCGSAVTDMLDLSDSVQSANNTFLLTLKNLKSPIYCKQTAHYKEFVTNVNSICDTIYIDYLSQSIDRIHQDIKSYCSLFSKEVTFANILRYGSYLIRFISSRSNIKSAYLKAAFHELTYHVNNLLSSGSPGLEDAYPIISRSVSALLSSEQIPVLSETEQVVKKAKQFILEHYNEPISLSQVAEYVEVNNCYLSSLLHKSLGEPYSKYIVRIRMEQAAKLLKNNPNEKIYKVAELTGFVSSKHFISVFKKFYGVTPTIYSEKYLQRNKLSSG